MEEVLRSSTGLLNLEQFVKAQRWDYLKRVKSVDLFRLVEENRKEMVRIGADQTKSNKKLHSKSRKELLVDEYQWLKWKLYKVRYAKTYKEEITPMTTKPVTKPVTKKATPKKVPAKAKKAAAKKASAKAKKAAAKKAPAKAKKAKGDSPGRGRPSTIDQKAKIQILVKKNPKREGTKGHQQFALYKQKMTVAEFMEVGGDPRTLHWDIKKEYISLQ